MEPTNEAPSSGLVMDWTSAVLALLCATDLFYANPELVDGLLRVEFFRGSRSSPAPVVE